MEIIFDQSHPIRESYCKCIANQAEKFGFSKVRYKMHYNRSNTEPSPNEVQINTGHKPHNIKCPLWNTITIENYIPGIEESIIKKRNAHISSPSNYADIAFKFNSQMLAEYFIYTNTLLINFDPADIKLPIRDFMVFTNYIFGQISCIAEPIVEKFIEFVVNDSSGARYGIKAKSGDGDIRISVDSVNTEISIKNTPFVSKSSFETVINRYTALSKEYADLKSKYNRLSGSEDESEVCLILPGKKVFLDVNICVSKFSDSDGNEHYLKDELVFAYKTDLISMQGYGILFRETDPLKPLFHWMSGLQEVGGVRWREICTGVSPSLADINPSYFIEQLKLSLSVINNLSLGHVEIPESWVTQGWGVDRYFHDIVDGRKYNLIGKE